MIINLTPHPLHIYDLDVERIERAERLPRFIVPPSGDVARIVETCEPIGHLAFDDQDESFTAIPVETVEYGHIEGLPAPDGMHPPRTYYVVSLVVALAAHGRCDLLVPHHLVREINGTVLGCRSLAAPRRSEMTDDR